MTSTPQRLEQVTDELYARHTGDAEAASAARRAYDDRRGKVHQDDDLWEAWSAAFVEWYVVERALDGAPAAAASYREFAAAGDSRAAIVRALVTSQRSLYEVRAIARGRIELLDLLGGAEFHVVEQRALHGVEVGDVAELRLVGLGSASAAEVRFGRTFIYHPKAARAAIVELACRQLANGASRRDVIDHVAQLRVQTLRYRHVAPERVYQLGSVGSRIVG